VIESSLPIVISDAYHSVCFKSRLLASSERYPELEVQCVFTELDDAISLVRIGRASKGILPSELSCPPEIGAQSLPDITEFTMIAGVNHPLASINDVDLEHLSVWSRQHTLGPAVLWLRETLMQMD
jgi:hypothetical protein